MAQDINVDIIRGELTAIIGVNGSGKSTFLKTITGNISPKAGQVFLGQDNLNSFSAKSLSEHISIVLSNAPISQNFTVNEVVAFGRYPYSSWLGTLKREDKVQIKKALRQIGIAHLGKRKCNELSDGQLQKVFIARALAQDTELILLDEPTNHLDLYHKYFVFKLLKNLAKNSQKAVVFATHELNMALQLCDKIILISEQKVIQDSPKKLIENGTLDKLFPDNLVYFDQTLKSFRLKE